MANKVSRNFRVEQDLYDELPPSNKSRWIRQALREKLRREKLGDSYDTLQQLSDTAKRITDELHKIGVNINQLAHKANMDHAVTFTIENKSDYYRTLRELNQNAKSIISILHK